MRVLLSEITAQLESGARPKGGATAESGEVPSLGGEHLDDTGSLRLSKMKMVPRAFYDAMKTGRISQNDILIVKDGATTGKVAFVDVDFPYPQAAINEHVFRLTLKPQLADARYVFHFLFSPEGQRQILSDHRGSTIGGIGRTFLNKVKIPLPPVDEQRRIAAILDQADTLRRNSKSLARQLKDLEKAYFVDCFGDLAAYPKAQFGDLIDSQRIGLVRGADEFGRDMSHPYVRMDAVSRDGDILESLIQTTEATAAELEIYTLRPGDFIFNTRNSRELVGKSAVWRGGEGYIFNNNLMRVRFGPLILADFVQFSLGTTALKHELEIRKTGTTSVFAIYWRDLKSLPLPVPPMRLQQAYAERLAQIGRLKASILARHSTLDNLFASLQHRAFTGGLTRSDERLLETA